MFATHAAKVEVDTETGVVKVINVVAAHDVGRAINPMTCEQQIEGSVVMGLSNALYEELKMEKGRVLNNGFADYKLATLMDIPRITPVIVEARHKKDLSGPRESVSLRPAQRPLPLPTPFLTLWESESRTCRLPRKRCWRH